MTRKKGNLIKKTQKLDYGRIGGAVTSWEKASKNDAEEEGLKNERSHKEGESLNGL